MEKLSEWPNGEEGKENNRAEGESRQAGGAMASDCKACFKAGCLVKEDSPKPSITSNGVHFGSGLQKTCPRCSRSDFFHVVSWGIYMKTHDTKTCRTCAPPHSLSTPVIEYIYRKQANKTYIYAACYAVCII